MIIMPFHRQAGLSSKHELSRLNLPVPWGGCWRSSAAGDHESGCAAAAGHAPARAGEVLCSAPCSCQAGASPPLHSPICTSFWSFSTWLQQGAQSKEVILFFFLGSRVVCTTSRQRNKYSVCVLARAVETRAFAYLPCSVLLSPQVPPHRLAFL